MYVIYKYEDDEFERVKEFRTLDEADEFLKEHKDDDEFYIVGIE